MRPGGVFVTMSSENASISERIGTATQTVRKSSGAPTSHPNRPPAEAGHAGSWRASEDVREARGLQQREAQPDGDAPVIMHARGVNSHPAKPIITMGRPKAMRPNRPPKL